MRLAFICSRDLSTLGGIETFMANLCPRLASRGHEVVLYMEGTGFERKEWQKIRLVAFPSFQNKHVNKLWIALLATVHALFLDRKFDVYHYNAIPSGLFSLVPLLFGKTVVFQGHGFEWRRSKWPGWIRGIIRWIDHLVLRMNRHLTMVSEEQSAYVREHFGKPCVTITPGVSPPPNSTPPLTALFAQHHLAPGEYFLYLGRLVEEKCADVLIAAFQQVSTTKKLVIAGHDDRAQAFIEKLRFLGKEDPRIVFTGAVYGPDKEALLAYCHAFCLPSEMEGLPITVLEAMSYGKACIVSDIPPCRQALAEAAYYHGVRDVAALIQALRAALHEPERLVQMGALAQQRIKEKFSWDLVVSAYDEFILSL
jgi:glycosyltransferase involved in cell wall biosynthesis